MGSSFEYTYTRLASRLRRSARWKCLETGEMTKPLETSNLPFNLPTFQPFNLPTFQPSNLSTFQPFNLSTLQPFPKVSRNRRNDQIPCRFTVSRHFQYEKCLEIGEMTKSLEIMTFQGILLFLLFLYTFHSQGILLFYCF